MNQPVSVTDELAARLAWLHRELPRADAASKRAADRSAAFTGARKGPRGGRLTSLEAKWMTAAEYRDRIQQEIWDIEVAK